MKIFTDLLKLNLIILIAVTSIFGVVVNAQTMEKRTSVGTDFIFSFSRNLSSPQQKLTLLMSSETNSSGVINLPKLGTQIAFTVEPNIVTQVSIPVSMAQYNTWGITVPLGIHVATDNPISLYALNQDASSTDAFLVLPTATLGKNYIVVGYNSSFPSQAVIVATKDNTLVTITPSVKTYNNAPAGIPFNIKLNKMEAYVLGAINEEDITGTKIESSAPVAVTSGAPCTNVPIGIPFCDHLVEMTPPVELWGQFFITYPLATRLKGDLVRVIASKDNTEIEINGVLIGTFAAGSYYDVILKNPGVIKTSAPSSVVQYSLGQLYDGVVSDPFMMIIPPSEQFLNQYTFSAPKIGLTKHFANVVIKTNAINSLELDGAPVDSTLFQSIDNGVYSGAQIPLPEGSHHLKATAAFGLYIYGYGDYESYGYPGGMATEIINPIDGDYKNVRVISSLATNGIELDLSSFTVAPIKIEHLDGETKIEWFFPEFAIGQIKNLDYEILAQNLLPGEKRLITSSLEMSYQDVNGVEHRRSLGKQELEVLASGFALNLGTDKAMYGPNQAVEILTTVANAGNVQSVVKLELEIRDLNGNVVANVSAPPAFTLPGGDSISLNPQQFLTGNTYTGDYVVYAALKNQEGIIVSENTAPFTIEPANTVQASIKTATDKIFYTVKDSLLIETTVSNLSTNSLLENVTVSTRVIAQNGNVYWSQSSPLTQLTPNANETLRNAVVLTDAAMGNYIVQTNIIDVDGAILASDQVNVEVRDNPLFALAGSVSVAKTDLGLGEQQACTYTVKNISASSVALQPIKLRMIRIDETAEVFTQEQTVTLNLQAEQTFSPEIPAPTAVGDYACVLEAISTEQTSVIASSIFSVRLKESPIKLNGDLVLGEKARLLVLIDSSTTKRTYLENLLTNAGWFYTIVDNAASFKTELTQGGYGVYALLSEKVTLDQATQNLLNTNVAAGDGLIVAGATDRRHQTLEQALGIKARANEAYANGIAVQESALGYAWERAFNKSSRVLNFSANGATVIGEYRNNLPGAPDAPTSVGPLGAAGRYGNFVWDNFTSLSSTVEGRIAVGGNLSLQNFSVGDKLDPNKLHDVVTVGGNVTFPSGRIYYGNLIAGGSVSGVGDPVRFGMAQGAVIRGNSALDINFTGEREYLQELSTKLATLPANGTVKMQWGGMELKGDCTSSSQVFNVNGADLGVAHTFAVSCIPANATLVFNVSGTSVTIKSMGMKSLTTLRDKVLFNFPQATSLKMTSVGIEGSILAPFAQVDQPAGRIDGQVIVKSWYSTTKGYMSIHNRFFGGDLSAVASQISKDALAVYQYQQGKSVFAGFDVLAQATAFGVNGENPFAQLLLSALEQVNPAPITARAGKAVPVVLTYENTGAQTATGQVKLALTGTITLLNSAGFTQVTNSNDWVLPLNLDAGVSNSQTVYVQLPASGASSITLQLQTGTHPNWETRFEKALNFSVQ